MPKSRVCFASSVCCSEAFELLPESARLLYYQLNFEADLIGEVVGARRISRGYGFADADLSALLESGFLIEAKGRFFIRHQFVHNKFVNEKQKTAAIAKLAETPDSIGFEGEEFKSAYHLMDGVLGSR